jgi:protein-arginine deiminase
VLLLLVSAAVQAQDLRLDGDTDRTGTTDGTAAERALKATKSVIVLNNCDDSNVDTAADHDDEVINGADDFKQFEPVIFRKIAAAPSGEVSISIKKVLDDDVPEKRRVRIFKADGTQIIGPSKATKYILTAGDIAKLRTGDLTLLVEGLAFRTSVRLFVSLGANEKDYVILEVAPFILTPHHLKAQKNWVVDLDNPESSKFVTAFKSVCSAAGVEPVVMMSSDRWIEDELAWGYTETPRHRMPVAMHMLRLRELRASVRALVKPNVGYCVPFRYPPDPALAHGPKLPSSINYGGNLEVAPPTPQHPFGRVYYGSIKSQDDANNTYSKREIDERFQEFFRRQKIQPAIELNSDWLRVGHVDELVTFVPTGSGAKCVMLLASPKMAFSIIRSLPPNTPLDERYELIGGGGGFKTVGGFLAYGQLQRSLEQYNLDADYKIFGADHAHPDPNSIKGKLKAALNLSEADIREVPVLFVNNHATKWQAVALSPGTVNLSSMGKHSLVPDPFLPAFKASFVTALSGTGNKIHWIDGWLYHVGQGEVHCGTNELREPFAKNWWK